MTEFEIIDITPTISEKIAVFPGDTPFSRDILMDFPENHLGLSTIKTTVHVGAHTDAPNHYHHEGEGIDTRDLNYYFGDCQVITTNLERGKRILPEDISQTEITTKRVLFKTNSFPDPNNWNGDFNSLSPELIQYLDERGVILVGIDTPSVDPADDKELSSHLEIYHSKMAILEGIVLSHVDDGTYILNSLPLKIKDADASPVRATLLKEKV